MRIIHLIKPFLVILFFTCSFVLTAQSNAPGEPGGGPEGGGEDPIGGGAPIGSGMFILGLLGGAYAAGKTYSLQKQKK